MSEHTKLLSGYKVSIRSWENDGDHRRTIEYDGLSKERAQFLCDFAKLFYSRNDFTKQANGPCFGNMYAPSKDEVRAALAEAKKVFLRHWDVFSKLYYDVTIDELESESALHDFTVELHHELFGGGDFKFRVLEGIEVVFVPETIMLKDVSAEFNI